ncbi:MAG: radical SAM protein [Paludibacteraceae bacterium]|nr:radical SAM protein [Paludibacteraceae bacterium]
MAGIYVHIPFCKKRCLYCDFFSTTLLARREEYIAALLKEIEIRRDETGEPFRTIYIGGGTPSTLEAKDIQHILYAIGTDEAEEITMELNPGDATEAYMHAIRRAGVNRLSIGIQSFDDELLTLIGRRHNAQQAIEAVHMAQQAGFDNLSIDLMYALPTQTWSIGKRTLNKRCSWECNIYHPTG